VIWPNLFEFYASDNAFSSTLSDTIGSFSNLKLFRIEKNKLTGTLPISIGNWSKLEAFALTVYSPLDGTAFNFEVGYFSTPKPVGAATHKLTPFLSLPP
jgi:hypothetical protein